MSALQDKYKELLDAATAADVSNLNVSEVNNVLHVSGEAASGETKDKLWDIYNKIDPDYRTGDLILDVNVAAGAGTKATVTTDSTNLNIRKGPGTDQPIVGKAAHGATVTLLSKANDQWWLIKNENGDEGYAYAQYLSPQ
ncbi:MAG: SH3 domain-containing protein [Bacteroidetes bacterium]|nr:SH3 domain-containing protein [Bacteroidota bacterium]